MIQKKSKNFTKNLNNMFNKLQDKLVIWYLRKNFGDAKTQEMCKKPYEKDCASCWAAQLVDLLEYIRDNSKQFE